MNKTEALIQTSQEAFDTARVLYQAGQAAPAVYYACHAFEQAGNAFATARGAATGQNHTKNLGAFKTQYHNAGLEGSLDPVLERVRLLRDPARYPVRREIADEGEQWGVPSAQITQRQADRLMGHVQGALYDTIFPNLWPSPQ